MRLTPLLGTLLIAGALTAIPTAAVASTDCSADLSDAGVLNLEDSTPARWDIGGDGSVGDGELIDGAVVRDDAYDDFTVFAIDDGTTGLEEYTNPGGTCTYEAGGRQIAFPSQGTASGLELSRKVYVPASGPGFARFYNQVHNPGASPVTVTLYTADGTENDLGSDDNTTLEDSSAGTGVAFLGGVLNSPVSWFTTSDAADSDGDPDLAHNLDAGFARTVRDRVDQVRFESSPDTLSFVYQDVTVPAGGTLAYLSFESMRPTVADAGAAARYIDSHPAELFTGLSPAELAAIQNWVGTDIDVDGLANAADNCPTIANPGQSDIDRDGQGDVCDSDADGDGIANNIETAFGTNPLRADTDADGVRDSADNCPKVAGAGVDGCPPATVVVNNVRRASRTKLKVTETKTGAVTIKAKGKVKLRGTGVRAAHDCTHGRAMVTVKVGKLAVSNKLVKLRANCTFKSKVTLHQPRRLVQKVAVIGRFLGSDGLLPSKKRVKLSS